MCRCPEVVSAALEGVWRTLMSCSSPEWPKVSEVMRRLVQQAGSDTDKLRLYRCGCVDAVRKLFYKGMWVAHQA